MLKKVSTIKINQATLLQKKSSDDRKKNDTANKQKQDIVRNALSGNTPDNDRGAGADRRPSVPKAEKTGPTMGESIVDESVEVTGIWVRTGKPFKRKFSSSLEAANYTKNNGIKVTDRRDSLGEAAPKRIRDINELSKRTLGSYIKKASTDAANKAGEGSWKHAKSQDDGHPDDGEKEDRKAVTRLKGVAKATNKLTKEDKHYKHMVIINHPGSPNHEKVGHVFHEYGDGRVNVSLLHPATSRVTHNFTLKPSQYRVIGQKTSVERAPALSCTVGESVVGTVVNAIKGFKSHRSDKEKNTQKHLGGTKTKFDWGPWDKKAVHEDAPAMAAGASGDPGHVQNPTDNYASQKKTVKMLRRKKPA